METAVIIKNQTIRLQAMLCKGIGNRGVVITHPHPLYGGNLDNPVVVRTTAGHDPGPSQPLGHHAAVRYPSRL
jgi:hypothetical protein